MATLAEIRARLAEEAKVKTDRQENRNNRKSGGDGAQFLFFNMKVGETSVYRLLPDGNQDNVFPWLERQIIELPFDGTTGGKRETTERVKIKVPCPVMFQSIVPDYKLACKITAHISPWWKPEGTAEHKLAQQYYKKRSWLTQGFVRSTPLNEENVPENPIRRATMTKQIFDKMFMAYNGTEFEIAPHDYDQGCDFNIIVTQQGTWNNYSTSDFQRRSSALTAEERAAIDTYGLFNLNDFVGKAPTEDQVDAQYRMFLDSLAGKPYDFAQFGEYYRPYGVEGPDQQSDTKAVENGPVEDDAPARTSAPASTPAAETVSESVAAPSANATEDLINRIRRSAAAPK